MLSSVFEVSETDDLLLCFSTTPLDLGDDLREGCLGTDSSCPLWYETHLLSFCSAQEKNKKETNLGATCQNLVLDKTIHF
jgi:hypothetical protein